VHVNLSSLFYFRHYVEHRTGLPIKSVNKIPLSGEVELFSFFEGPAFGSWHFDWFCLLISRNWRVRRQARPFTFGITLSTEQGCASSLKKFPLSGEVELISFFRVVVFWLLAFVDRFSILISRNWRARQARSFTFGITLSTEQGCPSSLNKIPLSGQVELISFFLGLSLIYWHLDRFRILISRNWRVRQNLLFYFRHYV